MTHPHSRPLISASPWADRKSTRLNSSHGYISYAVFFLKKKPSSPIRICPPRAPKRWQNPNLPSPPAPSLPFPDPHAPAAPSPRPCWFSCFFLAVPPPPPSPRLPPRPPPPR